MRHRHPAAFRGLARFAGVAGLAGLAGLAVLVGTSNAQDARVRPEPPRPPEGPSPHAMLPPAERGALQPVLKRNIADEINASVRAVPEDERGWPLYLRAIAMLEHDPFDSRSGITSRADAEELADDPAEDRFGDRTGAEIWAGRAAYLDRNAEALALLREAASRRSFGMIATDVIDPDLDRAMAEANPAHTPQRAAPAENPPAWGVLLPHLGPLRGFARDLVTDARIAVEQGDTARAIADLRAVGGMARQAAESPILISHLVGMALASLRDHTIASLLEAHPEAFTDADLAALADLLGPVSDGNAGGATLVGERLMVVDTLQRVYSDDGAGNGVMTVSGAAYLAELGSMGGEVPRSIAMLSGGAAALVAADRASERFVWEHFIHQSEMENHKPLWQRRVPLADDLREEINRLRRDHNIPGTILLAPILLPALDQAHVAAERSGMTTDAARARVAIERFTRATGRPPRDLAELVRAYLGRVPIDRWDGRPLRYRLIDGTHTIYSVGYDLDDDRGRPPADGPGGANRFASPETARARTAADPDRHDGDLVIIPQPG